MSPAAVTDEAAELGQLLAELVAFPTESRTPNLELIEQVAERLQAGGARTTVVEGADRRANLVASFGPEQPGGLMLSGHTDVVPAGSGWATDPYAVTKIGDALYGRGTADMKGFIAATMRVVERVAGAHWSQPLHVVLSFDEEVGCVGVRHALRAIVDRPDVRPDVVLVGEPTMMRPRHSHMGKLAYEVVCRAEPAHSSLSHTMPSAITSAVRMLVALDALQERYAPVGEAEVTFNCGTIAGGAAPNVIAERCTFALELRHTVDHDPDAVIAPFLETVDRERAMLSEHRGGVDVIEITRYPALRTPADDPWLRMAERIADVGPATSIGYGTEGGLFAEALDVPVVICGPGDIAVAHRPDEYVTVPQLLSCERFLHQIIRQICLDGAGALDR